MRTIDFKTKTEFLNRPAPCPPGYWVLGLDIGYSAIKGKSPNKVYCIPSYAKKLSDNNRVSLKADEWSDVYYRDEDGEWIVGALAYDEVNANEVMDSESELYGRNRYFSPMFKVIARTGIALGLMKNPYGGPEGKRIFVQAGLPPKYISDAPFIKEILSGENSFELKVGAGPWMRFEYNIPEDFIDIMPQPLGALTASMMTKDGRPLKSAMDYFNKNTLVLDPGFGTTDCYIVRKGRVDLAACQTFPDLAMKEVFRRTCSDIKDVFGVEITIPDLQNHLESGEVKKVDRRAFKSQKFSFDKILEKARVDVCKDMIERLKSVYNYFADIDYVIATGGTYDAWTDIIADEFKYMEDLKFVPANTNDTSLSNVYSNVRGYYDYRAGTLPRNKEG